MSPRVAVIGSGIAGLGAARALAQGGAAVEVFEAAAYAGGHSHTVDVDGLAVDTGFIIYNERTYPRLTRLFSDLGVLTRATDMSFSCACVRCGLEWGSGDLRALFAQRRNLWSATHYRLLAGTLGFFRAAQRDLADPIRLTGQSLGSWAETRRIPSVVMRHFVVPMGAAIWSAPSEQLLEFPALTLLRFFANHGMLGLTTAPTWRTVIGGSRAYVARLLATTPFTLHLNSPVRRLRRDDGGVTLEVGGGEPALRRFDAVVMATHADTTLALLGDPSPDERRLLGAIRFTRNETILHSDERFLPAARHAWSAWNHRSEDCRSPAHTVEVTYYMNRLQGLPGPTSYLVSLNPKREIDPALVHARIEYAHPRFDFAAVAAQRELGALQGGRRTWFAGAWQGYGFHEDGLRAGQEAATSLLLAAQLGMAA